MTAWLLETFLGFLHINLAPQDFWRVHFVLRKGAHISEYAIFSVLIYHALQAQQPRGWRAKAALQAVLAAGVYALTDEFHQSFVPGRTASLADSALDTVGAALGVFFIYIDPRSSYATAKRPEATSATSEETKKGAEGE